MFLPGVFGRSVDYIGCVTDEMRFTFLKTRTLIEQLRLLSFDVHRRGQFQSPVFNGLLKVHIKVLLEEIGIQYGILDLVESACNKVWSVGCVSGLSSVDNLIAGELISGISLIDCLNFSTFFCPATCYKHLAHYQRKIPIYMCVYIYIYIYIYIYNTAVSYF